MAVIAPKSWRAATLWSIVVVMGEVPSPPSQLIDSFARTVSLEVDTEGGETDEQDVISDGYPRLIFARHKRVSNGGIRRPELRDGGRLFGEGQSGKKDWL
jgi:hypothetical protein